MRKLPPARPCGHHLPSTALAQDSEVDGLARAVAELTAELELLSTRLDQIEEAGCRSGSACSGCTLPQPPASPPPVHDGAARPNSLAKAAGASSRAVACRSMPAPTSLPDGITDASDGFGSEIRRAYLGVEGRMPGGFGYRAEVELASSAVEITDLYLTYQASSAIGVTVARPSRSGGWRKSPAICSPALSSAPRSTPPLAMNGGWVFRRSTSGAGDRAGRGVHRQCRRPQQ